MPRTLLHLFVALTAALALFSCAGETRVHTNNLDRSALEAGTYAWVDERIEGPPEAIRAESRLLEDARAALDEGLAARGMRSVSEAEAGLLFALRLDTTVEIRQFDPQFAIYSLERYEKGHLTLAALEAVTFRELWRATESRSVRVTERALSRGKPVWETLDAEQDWQLEPMAERVLRAFPTLR